MRSHQWLALVLVIAIVLPAPHGSARAVEPPANFSPLGSGARFLPPETAYYLAGDFHPESEQWRFLDRLASIYVESAEARASQERLPAWPGRLARGAASRSSFLAWRRDLPGAPLSRGLRGIRVVSPGQVIHKRGLW
jgi:hypothetical protein